MWRAILLGKMSVFILASFVVGGICVTQPLRHEEYSMVESARWIGVGIFFLILAFAQIAAIYLMMKKKKQAIRCD